MNTPTTTPALSAAAFQSFGGVLCPNNTVAVGEYVLHGWSFPHHKGVACLVGCSPWDAVQIRPLTALERSAIRHGHVFPQVRVMGEVIWTDSEGERHTVVMLG